jgi:predicted acetyltransferase
MRFATVRSVRTISSLPGCNQVAVSHGLLMKPEYRGKGFGKEEQKLFQEELKRLAYDYVLCTVVESNKAQNKILQETGWLFLAEFKSSYTGNNIRIYGKKVITNA